MGFGQAQPQGGGGGNAAERYEARDLVIVSGEERSTNSGKVYWRVKDANNKYYSVWDATVKAELESASDAGQSVSCVVQIKKQGDKTYYTITGTGAQAANIAQASNDKAQASTAPGGRNSEFGKRMHPDDALRVTNLALEERAIQWLAVTVDDRPEGTNRMDYMKGHFLGVYTFLAEITNLPRTPTPAPAESKPEPSPQAAAPADDDDIPFWASSSTRSRSSTRNS